MESRKLFIASVFLLIAAASVPLASQTHELALSVDQGVDFTQPKGGSYTVGNVTYVGVGGGATWSTYPGTGFDLQYCFGWFEDDRSFLQSGQRVNIGTVLEAAYLYSPEASFLKAGGGLDFSFWRLKTQLTFGYGHFLGLIRPDDESKPAFSLDGACWGVSIGYEHPLKGLSFRKAQGFLFINWNLEGYWGADKSGNRSALRAGLRFVFPDRWSEEEYRRDIASD
jgi:hypothetical protein